MKTSRRIQDVLLAGLAAVAVGTSAYAVWSVNRPHPSPTGSAIDAPSPAAPGEAATATVTTEPPDTDGDSTASPTAGPIGADDAPATGTPDDEHEPVSIEEWVAAWEDDADLLVVGDGYSNLTSQWVQEWAALVGQERPVQIRHWGEAEDVQFTDAITLSEGEGPELRVWSASRGGTTITEAADRVDRFVQASADPAAVLVSLGMDSQDEAVAPAMDELLAGMPEVPLLVAIAPEGLYEPDVADDILTWAQDNEERAAVVDLRETGLVDPTAEEWALAFDAAVRE